jgi:hypothetical protein
MPLRTARPVLGRVAGLSDGASLIGLAGLVAARSEVERRPHGLRPGEARRDIDRRDVAEGDLGADTWDRHQAAADGVIARLIANQLIEASELFPEPFAGDRARIGSMAAMSIGWAVMSWRTVPLDRSLFCRTLRTRPSPNADPARSHPPIQHQPLPRTNSHRDANLSVAP